MTKEDFEFISKYEHTFYTAKVQSYARILPRSINERLHSILNDGANRNLGCSACVLGMYRKLYDLLLAEKKKVEKEPEPIVTEIVEQPINKKRATNKKTKKEE